MYFGDGAVNEHAVLFLPAIINNIEITNTQKPRLNACLNLLNHSILQLISSEISFSFLSQGNE